MEKPKFKVYSRSLSNNLLKGTSTISVQVLVLGLQKSKQKSSKKICGYWLLISLLLLLFFK